MIVTFTTDDAGFEAAALTVSLESDTSTTLTFEQFMSPTYHGSYTATLTATAGAQITETVTLTFTITIIDPCAGPLPITLPTMADINYLITVVDNVFEVPPFEVVPSDCAMTITFTVDDAAFEAAALSVVVAADTSSTWTIEQFTPRSYVGTYTATLTATAGA